MSDIEFPANDDFGGDGYTRRAEDYMAPIRYSPIVHDSPQSVDRAQERLMSRSPQGFQTTGRMAKSAPNQFKYIGDKS